MRKTAGWSEDNKQMYISLGYYTTRKEALAVLAKYNDNPYDVDGLKITFAEVYEKWSAERFPKMSDTNVRCYKAAYKHCSAIYDKKFRDLKKTHLQAVIDKCERGPKTLIKIKSIYGQLYKWAMQNDLVEKDYSQFVDTVKTEKSDLHKPFTDKEIKKLWDNIELPNIDLVLIMIYTGMRPGELVKIKAADIDLPERYMTGGIKTEAGKNRVIPLNKKIVPMVSQRLSEEGEYLVEKHGGGELGYLALRIRFNELMETLGMDHRPHDCRHTFATLMDAAGANKLSIKKIMGHATADITDGVYIHKNLEELLKAVDMI